MATGSSQKNLSFLFSRKRRRTRKACSELAALGCAFFLLGGGK